MQLAIHSYRSKLTDDTVTKRIIVDMAIHRNFKNHTKFILVMMLVNGLHPYKEMMLTYMQSKQAVKQESQLRM